MHINSISNVHTDLLVVDIIITLLCVLVFLHVKFITKLEGLLVVLTIVSMAILAEEVCCSDSAYTNKEYSLKINVC